MRVNNQVQQLYDVMIKDVTTNEAKWRDVCHMIGQLYRYEFDNILMVYAQRPQATLVADFDTWKKVDRFVKQGSKGIAIFPSRALKPYMRHVFDISDTGGRNRQLTWNLDENNLLDYMNYLASEGRITQLEGTEQEYLKEQLKLFTQTDVRSIIKEEFDERMTEIMQLTGSVIRDYNVETQELTVEQMVYKSIMYAVGTRCGFDLSGEEQDFSQIVNFSDEEVVYRLGSLVCDVSCSVLREFSKNLKTIERQKDISAERRIAYGRSDINVHGSGRTIVPESSITTGGREKPSESRQIRNDGIELSEGERGKQIQDTLPLWETSREDARSGRGSEPVVRYIDGELPKEEQTRGSQFNHGDVENKGTGEDAGRRNRTKTDSNAFSLENASEVPLEEAQDNELNKELDEINSLGQSREAEYHQASFFDVSMEKTSASKFTYMQPKKELVVPHEYIVEVIKRGTGFEGGKKRVCDIYQNVMEASERTKLIKKEYGLGGAGWPIDGYGLHGYDSFKANGLRFQWKDTEGEKEGYVSWSSIESEIGVLILTGEYIQKRTSIDEISMDGDREDLNISEDAIEMSDTDSMLDDFSIPDELDEMQGISDEELAEEDRLVTEAEYRAEIEAENAAYDDLLHGEVIDIDGSVINSRSEFPESLRQVELMDGELRQAIEIYVTECSSIKPYQPFLKVIYESNLLPPDKISFVIRTINHSGKEYSQGK